MLCGSRACCLFLYSDIQEDEGAPDDWFSNTPSPMSRSTDDQRDDTEDDDKRTTERKIIEWRMRKKRRRRMEEMKTGEELESLCHAGNLQP